MTKDDAEQRRETAHSRSVRRRKAEARRRRAKQRQRRKQAEFRAMSVEMREPELAGEARGTSARSDNHYAHETKERRTSSASNAAQWSGSLAQLHKARR